MRSVNQPARTGEWVHNHSNSIASADGRAYSASLSIYFPTTSQLTLKFIIVLLKIQGVCVCVCVKVCLRVGGAFR